MRTHPRPPQEENTEPVAPSSTTPTSFPPGLAASAYNPQERLQPRSAPCSVPRQPTARLVRGQERLVEESRKQRRKTFQRSLLGPVPSGSGRVLEHWGNGDRSVYPAPAPGGAAWAQAAPV